MNNSNLAYTVSNNERFTYIELKYPKEIYILILKSSIFL